MVSRTAEQPPSIGETFELEAFHWDHPQRLPGSSRLDPVGGGWWGFPKKIWWKRLEPGKRLGIHHWPVAGNLGICRKLRISATKNGGSSRTWSNKRMDIYIYIYIYLYIYLLIYLFIYIYSIKPRKIWKKQVLQPRCWMLATELRSHSTFVKGPAWVRGRDCYVPAGLHSNKRSLFLHRFSPQKKG